MEAEKLIVTKTRTGTYTHLESRDILAEIEKATKSYRHKRQVKALPIDELAKRAIVHYQELAAKNPGEKVYVHVWPVLPSGRGTSADFRYHLSNKLKDEQFVFIEVDPE